MATDLKPPEASNGIVEPENLDLRSIYITEEKRAALLRLFPEARTEGGKIDFDRLRLALGETVDVGRERYGMNWPGKADCFRNIQTPSLGTLIPRRDESVRFDTTENLIIEGDNLEVLKLLQKSYLGKVKMIYIDPPYNTGKDFIYPDNYSESLQTYLQYTGQVDEEGKKFNSNTDTDGRFHSKWMNMMYPRLYLARNLLLNDGLLFVSIDDSEVDNLRFILNDIFGEDAFLAQFVWNSKKGGGGGVKTVVVEHEYVLAFAKLDPEAAVGKQLVDSQPLNLTDEKGPYRKGRELNKWGAGSSRADRPTMFFPIPGPNGNDVYPIRNDGSEGRWRYGKAAMLDIVNAGNALFEARSDGSYIVYEKERSNDPRQRSYRSLILNAGTAADGTATLKELFGGSSPYDYPKPAALIRTLAQIADVDADDYILDFFAGSGTTAQACLELNQDNANPKFVLVQLPELTDRGDYRTIVDITKERVRRVIKTLDEEDAGKLDLNGGKKYDRGFRVFKLAESNFNTWNADAPDDPQALAEQLALHIDHVRPGRTQEDILFEILMKSGYPLTAGIESLELAGKKVFSIAEGSLLVCLEAELTMDVMRAMADRKPERVVCLDAGFHGNDQLKTNSVQIFKTLHRRTNNTKESSDVTVFRTV